MRCNNVICFFFIRPSIRRSYARYKYIFSYRFSLLFLCFPRKRNSFISAPNDKNITLLSKNLFSELTLKCRVMCVDSGVSKRKNKNRKLERKKVHNKFIAQFLDIEYKQKRKHFLLADACAFQTSLIPVPFYENNNNTWMFRFFVSLLLLSFCIQARKHFLFEWHAVLLFLFVCLMRSAKC